MHQIAITHSRVNVFGNVKLSPKLNSPLELDCLYVLGSTSPSYLRNLHNCCIVAFVLFGKREQKHKVCVCTWVKLQRTIFSIHTLCPLVALRVPTGDGRAEPILVGTGKHIFFSQISMGWNKNLYSEEKQRQEQIEKYFLFSV